MQLGAFHVVYLGSAGVSPDVINWPCRTAHEAAESLRRIRAETESVVIPWFERYSTPTEFADVLGDECDLIKGKLLLADGRPDKARSYFESYHRRLADMPSTAEVKDALLDVERSPRRFTDGRSISDVHGSRY
jgi:hypothetical protein